jgi:hypothetical protein
MTKKPNDVGCPAGPARVTRRNFWQLINKCLALARRVPTSPTDHPKLQGYDQPLNRQILKVPSMPAMLVHRPVTTSGTKATGLANGRDHPTTPDQFDIYNSYTWPRGPI